MHIVFVPLILWCVFLLFRIPNQSHGFGITTTLVVFDVFRTAEVFLANLPPPAFIPFLSYPVNDYLLAETNWAVIQAFVYFLYYLTLEPLGAVSNLSHHSLRARTL